MEDNILELTIEEAMIETGKELLDYFSIENCAAYLSDEGIYDIFDMSELDYMLESYTPREIADMVNYGKHFSTNDEYFTFDGYNNLYSMHYYEYEAEVMDYTDTEDFLSWAMDWLYDDYTNMIEDLQEEIRIDRDLADDVEVIIEG